MKRIVILGAGESGAGAAVLAKKEGFDVFVSDMSAIKEQLLHHQFHLKQKIYKYKNEKKNLYTGFGSRNNTRC